MGIFIAQTGFPDVLQKYTPMSLQGARINTLYRASNVMIESYLPDGSWLGIVDLDNGAEILSDFVQIDSDKTRLVSKLLRQGGGGTCIPCGTDLALRVRSTCMLFQIHAVSQRFK